jgi:nucleotide-binding universal stress UspA family protein
MLKIHTILYPSDLSSRSGEAFPLACSLGRDMGARVVVLHVVEAPASHGEIVARRQDDGFEKPLLKRLHEIHAPEQNVRVEHRLEEGDDVKTILRVADEIGAGLIIMGTHGRTGLSRVLMGSVAEQVVRQARCPVLTLKVSGL